MKKISFSGNRKDPEPPDGFEMHGTMQDIKLPGDFVLPPGRMERVWVNGVELRLGDRLRVHPENATEIIDGQPASKIAVVEKIDRAADSRIHIALVLETDPDWDPTLRPIDRGFFLGIEDIEVAAEVAE